MLRKRVSLTLDSLDGKNRFSLKHVLTSEVIAVDETNLVSLSSLSNWEHLQGLNLQRVPKGRSPCSLAWIIQRSWSSSRE